MDYNLGEKMVLIKCLGRNFFKTDIEIKRGYDYIITDSNTHEEIGYIHIYCSRLFNIYTCKDHKSYKYELCLPSFLVFKDRLSQDSFIKGSIDEIREFNRLLNGHVK